MPDYVNEKMQDYGYMEEKFGIGAEELEGLNVNALIAGFGLKTEEYTAEEVRTIIGKFGSMYKDDGGKADLYSIFDEDGRALEAGDAVNCIGFLENPGTLVKRTVFDLAHRVFYVDNAEAHELTDEQQGALASLADRYGVRGWNRVTTGEERETTGNYGWKLAFYLEGGDFACYSGSSGDMSHLPEGYRDLMKELGGIIKSINKQAEEEPEEMEE